MFALGVLMLCMSSCRRGDLFRAPPVGEGLQNMTSIQCLPSAHSVFDQPPVGEGALFVSHPVGERGVRMLGMCVTLLSGRVFVSRASCRGGVYRSLSVALLLGRGLCRTPPVGEGCIGRLLSGRGHIESECEPIVVLCRAPPVGEGCDVAYFH